MKRLFAKFKAALLAVSLSAAVLLTSAFAFADKLHLKDGRVLEGKIIKEGDGYLYFETTHGSIKNEQFFTTDQITKIERDTPAADAKPAEPKKIESRGSAEKTGAATRVAVLNFGPPSAWQGVIDNTVGIQIAEAAWRQAIPMLEKDKVNVVVVRVNSGGGLALEVPKFHELYQKEYKPRFRTVGWIESAISAAAMSPWVLEEFYFMPEGNMGACTAFSGRLNAAKGVQLEIYLAMMEKASEMGGRSPFIMRSMQIREPLSANLNDTTGDVTWFQDISGKYILNPIGQVFTFNANDAVKFKFARGVAATVPELMQAMGIQEYEIAGKQATDFIDENMRLCDKTEKKLGEVFQKYTLAIGAAAAAQDRTQRGAQVGIARRYLNEMRQMLKVNPNFQFMYDALDDEWFERQERLLRDLMR